MEGRSKYSPNVKPYLKTHDIIDSIDGFSHISLNYNMLPPIKIKTRPSIFIMKRKSNIKYDPNKARSQTYEKDFVNQVDDTKNIKLNTSFKKEIIEEKFVDSIELKKTKETIEQNFSDIELEKTKNENNAIEKKIEILDLADDNMTSMENDTTWEIESINKLLNSKDKNEENIDSQEDFDNVSDSDVKPDKKTKIEEENIKEKSKNDINLRQETLGVKESVKKMIQEKMLEVKQRREVNDERKNIELPVRPIKKKGVAAEMLKRIGVLKQELKEPIVTDKSAIMKEESKIMKEHMKDDELNKQKSVTQKKDKIKVIKSDNLEQSEDITEEENISVEIKVDSKKIIESRDKVDTELPITEAEIAEKENKEDNIKILKSIKVRESIRNIINQFKEFEKDFIHEDADIMTTNDMSNHIESDSYIGMAAEKDDKVMVKDARESLKEIIDQFKYIKHELTSEEDDQFDEIATKYMKRPIAEILLQFNEALKALIQRRKKTSKEHVANLHDNKDIYISENQRKSVAEESNANSNNVNINEKESSQKNTESSD